MDDMFGALRAIEAFTKPIREAERLLGPVRELERQLQLTNAVMGYENSAVASLTKNTSAIAELTKAYDESAIGRLQASVNPLLDAGLPPMQDTEALYAPYSKVQAAVLEASSWFCPSPASVVLGQVLNSSLLEALQSPYAQAIQDWQPCDVVPTFADFVDPSSAPSGETHPAHPTDLGDVQDSPSTSPQPIFLYCIQCGDEMAVFDVKVVVVDGQPRTQAMGAPACKGCLQELHAGGRSKVIH